MWSTAIALAVLCNMCFAQWGTFYSFLNGQIYMRLKNNDMVSLNFSITGFDDLDLYSSYSIDDVNIKSGQLVNTMSLPPSNASIFLLQENLYAFMASDDVDDDGDICGSGVLRLLQYDRENDSWESSKDELTFNGVEDHSFYSSATYLVSDDSSVVYIYGGKCDETGISTDRLLAFDMQKKSFSNITTATKPQPFFGAANLWAPSPQNLLVVGGKSQLGWLNMKQLATWNFNSGWLFQLVEISGNESIGSRINPLVLPVFKKLADNATATFESTYSPSSVLVFGGEANGQPDPEIARIRLNSNQWVWESVELDFKLDDVMGAAAIFNTLVVVNKSLELSKRDQSHRYTLELYDISTKLASVEDLKANTLRSQPTNKGGDSGSSIVTKAVAGTLVPIAAIGLIATAGLILWKKKKAKNADDADQGPMDYQLGHFRTALDQHYHLLEPSPLNVYHHSNDTNSTLDDASIDSWVRKRQEFDAKRLRTLKRHSYLASNETLNGHKEEDELTEMVQVPTDILPLPCRTHQLRKSLSFTNTPPQLPQLKKKSRLDPGFIDIAQLGLTAENIDDESDDSLELQMDVQVLVSSKRKSILRIVNPDMEAEKEDCLRQRTPSK